MKLRCAVVGATGIAGQQFLVCLDAHPWFEVVRLAASERSAGKTYREAITDGSGARRWWAGGEPPAWALDLPVEDAAALDARGLDIVFAAVESDAARDLEPRYAQHAAVISTASAFRYEPDVPILVPGVNMHHADAIAEQRRRRGWRGFIAPIPNCTVTGLAVTLKPLAEAFGLRHVVVTTMQGLSGAGRSPGVIGLDALDNVIPYIPKEEQKVQIEGRKVLGSFEGGRFRELDVPISATCTRVPVLEGHTEAAFVGTRRPCGEADAAAAFAAFGGEFCALGLPSAPARLITVHDDPFRPQPRLDRDADGGMTTSVGRIRAEEAIGPGVKYVLVTHNTKMGAARGAVLVAEYLTHAGYIKTA